MKVVVVGGGIAGLTCSIYLARFGYNVYVYNNYSTGSLSETDWVENFPGFPNGISGFDLLNNIQEQAEKVGVEIYLNKVLSIDSLNKTITLDNDNIILYDIVVFATGMTHKTLPIENILKFNFIHYCATCDGPLYKNKSVAVVGGGDTALTEALYLSDICKEVLVFVRRDQFRASNNLIEKVKNKKNIMVFFNSNITNIYTDPNRVEINQEYTWDIDGVFISIGFNPNDSLFKDKDIKDCFICGDCLENPYRQAIIAAGEGAKTAIDIHNRFN